ncbi:unnamed protein product [Closterium sp. Naga37s-1]|nr:unnamed protein product [Closterium sp. Naga37s-1]
MRDIRAVIDCIHHTKIRDLAPPPHPSLVPTPPSITPFPPNPDDAGWRDDVAARLARGQACSCVTDRRAKGEARGGVEGGREEGGREEGGGRGEELRGMGNGSGAETASATGTSAAAGGAVGEEKPYHLQAVAHSLGGAAMMIYLLTQLIRRQPHRLSRLILLSPAGECPRLTSHDTLPLPPSFPPSPHRLLGEDPPIFDLMLFLMPYIDSWLSHSKLTPLCATSFLLDSHFRLPLVPSGYHEKTPLLFDTMLFLMPYIDSWLSHSVPVVYIPTQGLCLLCSAHKAPQR